MNKIKLLILDCDGVLTSGRKTYDQNGVCMSKEFCDKDFSAIKRFRANGVNVCVLSGDPWNEAIFLNRNIPFFNARGANKEDMVSKISTSFNVTLDEIAFIGDDVFDLGLLRVVGFPFAPSDSFLRWLAPNNTIFLKAGGGDHVVMEVFNYFSHSNLMDLLPFEEEYQKILDLDKNEKF